MQEAKNPNLVNKNCTQENVKCHIQHEESWLRWIALEQVNYNIVIRKGSFRFLLPWLQVTLLPAYISWKKLWSHHFKVFSEQIIVMDFEKMKAKYMMEDVWKSFFRKILGWHLATSLQINFFTNSFQGF